MRKARRELSDHLPVFDVSGDDDDKTRESVVTPIPSTCRDQKLGPHSSNQQPRVRLRLLLCAAGFRLGPSTLVSAVEFGPLVAPVSFAFEQIGKSSA
jgi:hypothetical protein